MFVTMVDSKTIKTIVGDMNQREHVSNWRTKHAGVGLFINKLKDGEEIMG